MTNDDGDDDDYYEDDGEDHGDEDKEMLQHSKLGPHPTSTILCKPCSSFGRAWPSDSSSVLVNARH